MEFGPCLDSSRADGGCREYDANMDKIRVRMLLENEADHSLWEQRRLSRKKVRKAEVDAVVDTGAVLILLPEELVEKLGRSSIEFERLFY